MRACPNDGTWVRRAGAICWGFALAVDPSWSPYGLCRNVSLYIYGSVCGMNKHPYSGVLCTFVCSCVESSPIDTKTTQLRAA